jgi:hypothetical protein
VKRRLRHRFWIEATMATVSGIFFLLTLFWKDWIEIVFGFDPDHHSGSLEWLIAAVSFAITIIFFVLARVEWRRAPALNPEST